VNDLVHGKGRSRTVRVGAIVRGQFLGDLVQPFVELALRPGIECGKTSHDPCLALGDDQFRPRYDEQRRADDGQAHPVKGGGQGHP
jgi:hypothetical protein